MSNSPASRLTYPRDQHSAAQPNVARVTHLSLDLKADFTSKILRGSATLTLDRTSDAREVVLDTDGLAIESTTDANGKKLTYRLDPRDPVMGNALHVELEKDTKAVVVKYATSPAAAAVQWLDPAQTAGKTQPFLFTQGQAILTRTWIPIQDSPAVRLSYDATIEVPEQLVAVMSANRIDPDGSPVKGSPHTRSYRFDMPHPIPAYLIALSIGQLEFRSLGPRSGVFAEPSVVESAASEFRDIEKMIEAAEQLYGPYRWGRYDVLVLPPSFPFGGMENPCLTFATPTILAGDRSLVSLVAHELAHSWSGNLVTNATWQDFWMNEGFTVYFENRIMEQVYGKDYADMLKVLGFQDLVADLDSFGRTSSDTQLYTKLEGRNPDDAFSSVPYEKGALFLRLLEGAVGRAAFDRFLRGYFDTFAFQSMTTERFERMITDVLFHGDASRAAALNVKEWLYAPGLRADAAPPESSRLSRVEKEVTRFSAGAPVTSLEVANWSTHEWLHFLRKLPERVDASRIDDLDRVFKLLTSGNCEKRFEFLRVCIRNDYRAADSSIEQFLTMQGRRKYLKPLYQDLLAKDWGKPLAKAIYQKARPGYHAVSSNTIDKLIEGNTTP